MENTRILEERGSAIVRKAQIVGAITGAFITVGGAIFLKLCAHCNYSIVLNGWGIILAPSALVYGALGLDGAVTDLTSGPTFLRIVGAVLANGFLVCLIGTLVGLALAYCKRTKK